MKTRIALPALPALPALIVALLVGLAGIARTASACGCYFSAQDIAGFRKQLESAESTVEQRRSAARMLAMANLCSFDPDEVSPKVLDALVKAALNDADAQVREGAVRGLGCAPVERHAEMIAALVKAMGDAELAVRQTAAFTVASFGFEAKDAAAKMREVLAQLPADSESDKQLREALSQSIEFVTTPPVVEETTAG
ncbi:MAG: HEAT repeat domain-containing protein [Planctomycetota bacterium]